MTARGELAEQHRQLLEASAISEEVVADRGYWTAIRKAELETLGFKRAQCIVPALVIPIRNANGGLVNYQVRPDQPRIGETGRPVKYESPAGIPPTLDVPPRCRTELGRPFSTLWITEGARKADAAASAGLCCVSLPGVWSWAKRLNGDARQVLPDLQRVSLEERKVVIGFDSDAMVKPSVRAALEALASYLTSQGALVSFAYLPELEPGVKVGLDDFLARHPVEDLHQHVEAELRQPPEEKSKRAVALPTPHLLGYVQDLLRKFVHFPDDHGVAALALYVLHSWTIDAVTVTPYVYIKSPQKRSGKTRLLETLELVCRKPMRAASITEAALFQVVESMKPTLLIDEADAIFTARSERADALRGVLNAGNRRGSKAIRGGAEGSPIFFDSFGPKVLAGIDTGTLPDTIRDRSIVIGLERKKHTEPVERLRVADIEDQVAELQTRLGDWAAEHAEEIGRYRCEPLPALSDRLEEAWEPLLAVAELAGGDWPTKARDAAKALAGGSVDTGIDHGQLLLVALQRIFGNRDKMFTKDITQALNADDELPFGAHRRGEGIDGRGLATLLKPFKVHPQDLHTSSGPLKGYKRAGLEEVWERYAPAQPPADDPRGPRCREAGPTNGSAAPNPGLADTGPLSASHPRGPHAALQSGNGDGPRGIADVADEVRPPAGGWDPEAVDAFVSKAKGMFPGSAEEAWRPRPGCGIEPTPEQCADPGERVRLWQEHGVRWIKPDAMAPAPSPLTQADLPAWMAANGYPASLIRAATKANGEPSRKAR